MFPKPNKRLPGDVYREVYALHTNGMGAKEIAERYGWCRTRAQEAVRMGRPKGRGVGLMALLGQ